MLLLADVKQHLRVTHAHEDALITALIASAYLHAEQISGTRFSSATETQVLDGFPASAGAIELPWTPVRSITAVDYNDSADAAQTLAQVQLDTRPVYPTIAPLYGSQWPGTSAAPQSVTITAEVGMVDTPADVRAALLLLIGHLYEHRESVIIGPTVSKLPMATEALLAPYKIHRIG